ncbi:MAG: ATP-binding protein [Thermodesulfobacteriota bacterium]
METHFAPAERLTKDALQQEIELISNNPVVDELLHSVSGVLAVLNEHRQILAVNDLMMEMLSIADGKTLLGLRPGEAVHCVNAHKMPGGCGTSEECRTCGAVISILACLTADKVEESVCVIKSSDRGEENDHVFRVRCSPFRSGSNRFLFLFLQDISQHQRLLALERIFFHDINNIVAGILNASELMATLTDNGDEEINRLSRVLERLSKRLTSEISTQRCIRQSKVSGYQPVFDTISVTAVFNEIKVLFSNHPAARNRSLVLETPDLAAIMKTDVSLLLRVLGNMITNALEETPEGDEVRIWSHIQDSSIIFYVWNRKPIPADIAHRIFQRNFSTKAPTGRGFGTYSMKLFGEGALGGKVDFSSSPEGTVFQFRLRL